MKDSEGIREAGIRRMQESFFPGEKAKQGLPRQRELHVEMHLGE